MTFEGCTSLQSVDIHSGVRFIGELIFGHCTSLKSIHIHLTELEDLKVDSYAFRWINKDKCILYVPAGMKQAYSNHPVFCEFKNIEIEKQY